MKVHVAAEKRGGHTVRKDYTYTRPAHSKARRKSGRRSRRR